MKIVRGARPRTAATSAAHDAGCANQRRIVRPPSCEQRSPTAGHQAPITRPAHDKRHDIIARQRPPSHNRPLDTGQWSRAMPGQRTGVARAHSHGDDEEAPPCAAAPWPMQR
ncbi:flowering time control protein FCA-like [Dorcoceras hygrometricum]|uniref:Flowering time control protein FCA-like n=1 Tax=Dorcoceras hygrometricum TaxID=472368 RepID=A0A2Z7AF70_9LAMI|nr:flowering time control protein FCA-like [Dorcoceras hygrometricum]